MSLTLTIAQPAEDLWFENTPAVVSLAASLSDSLDSRRFLELTYDWGDGSDAVTVNNFDTGEPIEIKVTHTYAPGAYTLQLRGNNRVYPTNAEVSAVRQIVVGARDSVTIPFRLTGPILPLDASLPNRDTWMLDTGTDAAVLESSLKSLLLTTKGERLHVPDFGTNLRALVFNQNTDELVSIAHENISTAIARWEPRVRLLRTQASREDNVVTITIDVLNLITNTAMTVALPFSL